MNQDYNTIDVQADFSKNALLVYFGYDNMKKIKLAMDNNNYSKLAKLFKIKNNEATIHNCLIYSLHFGLDWITKKIIRNHKLDINKNHSEIFKLAVYYSKNKIAMMLLDIGADINIDNDYVLTKYCLMNDPEMVKLLLSKGANVYSRNCLPLIQAAGNGHISIVKLLLEKMNKKVIDDMDQSNQSNQSGQSHQSDKLDPLYKLKPTNFDLAMISATLNNHTDIVLLLLLAGANPAINDSEVLVHAADNGNSILVKLFLDYGSDVNSREGIALKKACMKGWIDIVKILVSYRAWKPKLLDEQAYQKDAEYTCDLSIDDSSGLRWAAYKGYYDIVKLLVDSRDKNNNYRCNIHAENNDAYRLAVKYGHDNIVGLLSREITD